MILDTSGLREGHTTLQLFSVLESVKENLPPFSEPVQCAVEIDRHEVTTVVHLGFSGRFDQQCARCLEFYEHQISGEISLILQEADGRSGQAGENETADYYFNSEDFLVDVSPSIYDEIMTSLPLKPLCSDTCVGIVLKSDTGNVASKPDEHKSDPRWEALRKFQKKTQI